MLQSPETYAALERQSARLAEGLQAAAAKAGVPLVVNRVGSMVCPFFVRRSGDVVQNYAQATACDTERFARFFNGMLNQGVYLPPSQFEAWFVSLAHDDAAIDQTVAAAEGALAAL